MKHEKSADRAAGSLVHSPPKLATGRIGGYRSRPLPIGSASGRGYLELADECALEGW